MVYTSGDDNKILAINFHERRVVQSSSISIEESARAEDKGKQSTAATLSYF